MVTHPKNHIPKVSIGLPVYNGEKYIREALDSLLFQTFADFELIISDNASTDETEAICREYVEKDSRIRYMRQPGNCGALANFQFVLREAKGEYFMFASHDDIWDKYWISKLVDKLQRDDASAAFGRLLQIAEDSKVVNYETNYRTFEFIGNRIIRRISYFLQPENLGKANPIYALFRRTLLNSSNFSIFYIKDENAPGTDILFIYDILKQTEIHSVSDTYFYKRLRDNYAGSEVFKEPSRWSLAIRFMVEPIFVTKNDLYYCNLSTSLEKLFIIISLPLKILWRYWVYARSFMNRKKYWPANKNGKALSLKL